MNLKALESEQTIDTALFGNKAAGLHVLFVNGIRVPKTFLLAADIEISKEDIDFLFTKNETVIVRSSSQLEDSTSMSYAGVFLSLKATRETIASIIEQIRSHAIAQIQNLFGQKISRIALVIQPFITGIGGVYLYDKEAEKEKLDLSMFGSDSITSGKSSHHDLFKTNSKEYRYSLNECRKVASQLSVSLDLEFVFEDAEISFLQFRQLTKSIHNISEDKPEGSEYFPYPIKPLCGTLWAETLTKSLGVSCVYSDSYVKVTQSEDEEQQEPLDENKLAAAVKFYSDSLFAKWRNELDELKNKNIENENENFVFVLDKWKEFIHEYFTNEYESTIDNARENSPIGASLSPNVCKWFNDLNELAALSKTTEELKEHPKFKLFIEQYGKSFIPNSNYFNAYSLSENPKQLLGIIQSIDNAETKYKPVSNPTLILKAAWIAEDDNKFKNEFSFYLRKAVLRLATNWVKQKFISNMDEIWEIEIDELLKAIYENRKPKINKTELSINFNFGNDETIFQAEVLASGDCSGEVFTEASEATDDKIFVKNHLDSWDYPTLLKSKAAVVGFGSINAHFAIFARDFNKPVFKSFSAASKLTSGCRITLNSKTKTITVTT